MSKNKKLITGRILLFSRDLDFVTNRAYKSKNDRQRIIQIWKRQYPTKDFFIIIKPNIDEN
jgi:hypothetical protein